ncbi:Hypothetical predicted protein [Pelobates cultripes]|uniref:Uncharacterized protein n=1 Tax=Pelobates cultripes TaxID=61616 RepID=A0AAD1WG53_PELCU|nr:Hypothetical predicted protein [Pelobates cultripes]
MEAAVPQTKCSPKEEETPADYSNQCNQHSKVVKETLVCRRTPEDFYLWEHPVKDYAQQQEINYLKATKRSKAIISAGSPATGAPTGHLTHTEGVRRKHSRKHCRVPLKLADKRAT